MARTGEHPPHQHGRDCRPARVKTSTILPARWMPRSGRLKPESLTVHTLAIKRSSRLHLENAPLPAGETGLPTWCSMGLDTAHQLGMKPLLPLPPEVHGGQSGERRLRAAGSCLSIQCGYYGRNDAHPRPRRGRHFQTRLSRRKGHIEPCAERIQHRAVHCPRGGNDWAQKSTFPAGNATLTAKSTFRRRQISPFGLQFGALC